MYEEIIEATKKGNPIKLPCQELIQKIEHVRGYTVNCKGKIVQLIKKSEDVYIILSINRNIFLIEQKIDKNKTLMTYDIKGEPTLEGRKHMSEGDIIDIWGDVNGIEIYKNYYGREIIAIKITYRWSEFIKNGEIDIEERNNLAMKID